MPAKSIFPVCLAIVVFACYSTAGASQASSTRVEQSMSSGTVKWTSAFGIEIAANEIRVNLGISLLVPETINRAILEVNIKSWEAAIASTWNNRFEAVIDERKLPVHFNVNFSHHQPHQRVIIRPGIWRPNQHNWYVNMPAAMVAHEIGHMLGAYDEYRGGALEPGNPVIDADSIMGAAPANGVAYSRHLALLKKHLLDRFENSEVSIREY